MSKVKVKVRYIWEGINYDQTAVKEASYPASRNKEYFKIIIKTLPKYYP